jgi:hypothetical protein
VARHSTALQQTGRFQQQAQTGPESRDRMAAKRKEGPGSLWDLPGSVGCFHPQELRMRKRPTTRASGVPRQMPPNP